MSPNSEDKFLNVALNAKSSDRLDKYLSQNIALESNIKQEYHSYFSRSKIKKYIQLGFVKVNGRGVEPSFVVRKGDEVSIRVPLKQEAFVGPEDIPLKIIYEDSDCIVIDKPAGMVVHPALGHFSGTVVNAILAHLKKDPTVSIRPGIVHRLDKDTSGLMVVAKNEFAEKSLRDQFKIRVVKKTYLALVRGILTKKEGVIDKPIGRNPKNRQKFGIVANGKEAQTNYEVLDEIGKYSLVEAKPLTGRTHQIRVHLSSLGHPLIGDRVYGTKLIHDKIGVDLDRQFLHASQLEFRQPSTNKVLSFNSKLPFDLENFLNQLKKHSLP